MKRKKPTLVPVTEHKITVEELELVASFRKLSDREKYFAAGFMERFAASSSRNDRPTLRVIEGGTL